jgi:hypothetical protein
MFFDASVAKLLIKYVHTYNTFQVIHANNSRTQGSPTVGILPLGELQVSRIK